MRLYVPYNQLEPMVNPLLLNFLLNKGVPYLVLPDARSIGSTLLSPKGWGCVLCPAFNSKEVDWLLKAWNQAGECWKNHNELISLGLTESPRCLIACPVDKKDDPFVRTLCRKLLDIKCEGLMDWDKRDGVIPVIAQDATTKKILMHAWMDEGAYEETLRTGRAVYFSTSRRKLWRKGEESGNFQQVKEIYFDCDADCIVLMVDQIGGAACHEGYQSCFFRRIEADGTVQVVGERIFDPKAVYKK